MKTKFGAIIVDGRGKIGGHVASKNRSGSYLRTKVTPVNPQTAAQTAVRSRFGNLAQVFRGLTVAQVQAWNEAVSQWSKTNIFGDSVKPSGLNLFIQLNSNILNVGGTLLVLPPTPLDMPSPINAAVNFTVTGTVAELLIQGSPTGQQYAVLKATPKISNGVNYVKNLFRQIYVGDLGTGSDFDIESAWFAAFGSFPAVGERHVCSVDIIHGETGQVLRNIETTYTVIA